MPSSFCGRTVAEYQCLYSYIDPNTLRKVTNQTRYMDNSILNYKIKDLLMTYGIKLAKKTEKKAETA